MPVPLPSTARLAATLAIIGLLALGGSASGSSSSTTVRLQDTAVHPPRVFIRRGATVTWRFLDGANDEAHTVTSYGRLRFASTGPHKTGSYSVRFTHRGTYLYMCSIHFNMQGRIIVG